MSMSQCDKCGRLWPSAPLGTIHKCQCSGGYCHPISEESTSSKFVPEALRKAAAIYEERNKLYGDNYKTFGLVMRGLFPNGFGEHSNTIEFHNRLGVLIQIVSKLTRYCQNFDAGGHADSLDDLAVYTMMLQELDAEANG